MLICFDTEREEAGSQAQHTFLPRTSGRGSLGSPGPTRDYDPHVPLLPSALAPYILPSAAQQGLAKVRNYGQNLMSKSLVRSLPQPPAFRVVTGVSDMGSPLPVHVCDPEQVISSL